MNRQLSMFAGQKIGVYTTRKRKAETAKRVLDRDLPKRFPVLVFQSQSVAFKDRFQNTLKLFPSDFKNICKNNKINQTPQKKRLCQCSFDDRFALLGDLVTGYDLLAMKLVLLKNRLGVYCRNYLASSVCLIKQNKDSDFLFPFRIIKELCFLVSSLCIVRV